MQCGGNISNSGSSGSCAQREEMVVTLRSRAARSNRSRFGHIASASGTQSEPVESMKSRWVSTSKKIIFTSPRFRISAAGGSERVSYEAEAVRSLPLAAPIGELLECFVIVGCKEDENDQLNGTVRMFRAVITRRRDHHLRASVHGKPRHPRRQRGESD